VDSRLSTHVVDLRRRGIEFEQSMVDGAWDGLGERVDRPLLAAVRLDGGDGGGDYGSPFLVCVAVCHLVLLCFGEGCC